MARLSPRRVVSLSVSSIEHDARAARLQHGAACFPGEHVRLSAEVLRSKCCYGGPMIR
jgi:hypothetical protein